uniref:Uncharacterized protein n=1 Tax=Nothobranchius korthausae TaxID=1143690 RepID=A0A1A8HJ18_9TELE
MAAQEEQQLTVSESPVPGPLRTGRAVALARLLHRECTDLLQLYKEKETDLLDHTPDDERIVTLSSDAEEPSTEEQVQMLHSALRKCLGLLHCVILREEEEWGKLEGSYETKKENVRTRLEHLLHTTKDLVGTEDTALEVTPDHPCNEDTDGVGGVFALKLWTFHVLLELIHWADHAAKTLYDLHLQRGGTDEI